MVGAVRILSSLGISLTDITLSLSNSNMKSMNMIQTSSAVGIFINEDQLNRIWEMYQTTIIMEKYSSKREIQVF